jgi:hypothetical protein
VIIAHFFFGKNKYPLISQKRADFELFKLALSYMLGLHLTMEGLKKIIAIKYSINKGLTDNLKVAFPNITPVSRPLIQKCNSRSLLSSRTYEW